MQQNFLESYRSTQIDGNNTDSVRLRHNMLDWQWFDNSHMVHIFICLLISANSQNKNWHGILVKRGQYLTTVTRLHDYTNIPSATIRRCLKNLQKTGEIITETTNKWTIITICNYDSYQVGHSMGEQTSEQTNEQTSEQTNAENQENQEKKVSKEKNNNINNNNINIAKKEKQINKFICEKKKGLEERKQDFAASLEPYLGKYGKDMLNDFYSYWTETNDGGYKMRWEKEKTFCLSNRLAYWKRRDECSKNPKYNTANSAGIKLGYDERIETLPDGTKKRTYGKGSVTVPFEAPPREWGEIWGAQEKCWIQG